MDIPRLGITLAGIRTFVTSLSTPLDGKTATEVRLFVKTVTLARSVPSLRTTPLFYQHRGIIAKGRGEAW